MRLLGDVRLVFQVKLARLLAPAPVWLPGADRRGAGVADDRLGIGDGRQQRPAIEAERAAIGHDQLKRIADRRRIEGSKRVELAARKSGGHHTEAPGGQAERENCSTAPGAMQASRGEPIDSRRARSA
jgi:hypothetical protein